MGKSDTGRRSEAEWSVYEVDKDEEMAVFG